MLGQNPVRFKDIASLHNETVLKALPSTESKTLSASLWEMRSYCDSGVMYPCFRCCPSLPTKSLFTFSRIIHHFKIEDTFACLQYC